MNIFSKVVKAITLALLVSTANGATKDQITIFTGFQKGTYNVIGEDIKKACTASNIQIEPGGSLNNLNSLVNETVANYGHKFALVQKDVYDMIIKPTKPPLVKIVTPLFKEEILVLVNKSKGIKNIKELNGRKVAAGTPGSGIWFTSNAMEKILQVNWLNIERTPEESILLLLTGEIDGMIVVASNPLRLFEELPLSFSQYVDVLNIQTHHELDVIYPHNSTIESSTYIWQKAPIHTKSTTTYLIAADEVPQAVVKEIKTCLTTNLQALKKLGHQKWKSVQIQ